MTNSLIQHRYRSTFSKKKTYYSYPCWLGSVVGIATGYGAGRSGDRIPVGTKFSAPVQIGRGAHPSSYTIGTGCFVGGKRPRRGVDHPPTSSTDVKERGELYLYTSTPSTPTSWPVLGRSLPLPLYIYIYTMISRLTKIIRSGITFVSRNLR